MALVCLLVFFTVNSWQNTHDMLSPVAITNISLMYSIDRLLCVYHIGNMVYDDSVTKYIFWHL